MTGVLEPEELEAFMDSAESARDGNGKYDFARQDYALQRLLPALNQLQLQFAESGKESLRTLLPTLTSISIDNTSAMRFDELRRRLPAPCNIALYNGLADGASMLMAMESELIFQMVDRYYGGFGGAVPIREKFSVTEESFSEQANELLKTDIAKAWKTLLVQTPSLVQQTSDIRTIEAFGEQDSMVACRFVLDFGGGSDNVGLWLALPWTALDDFRERLDDTPRPSHGDADVQWQQRLSKRLELTPIEMTAILAETEISLKRVLGFKPGDIIDIPAADAVTVCLDGQRLMFGRLGAQQGNFAVRIEGHCAPEEE